MDAKDEAGRTFVVEIQLLHLAGFSSRVVYNACKTYVAQLPAGGAYAKLHDVVALSICNFELWPDADASHAVPVPLVSTWSMREAVSGRADLLQVKYAFVELPKVDRLRASTAPRTPAETWAWLFRDAVRLTTMPDRLSPEQEGALHLAEGATFSFEEAEAYRRAHDEIAQAEQWGQESEARGKARGQARGEARGEAKGLRTAVLGMCEVLGIVLTEAQKAAVDQIDASASGGTIRCHQGRTRLAWRSRGLVAVTEYAAAHVCRYRARTTTARGSGRRD